MSQQQPLSKGEIESPNIKAYANTRRLLMQGVSQMTDKEFDIFYKHTKDAFESSTQRVRDADGIEQVVYAMAAGSAANLSYNVARMEAFNRGYYKALGQCIQCQAVLTDDEQDVIYNDEQGNMLCPLCANP